MLPEKGIFSLFLEVSLQTCADIPQGMQLRQLFQDSKSRRLVPKIFILKTFGVLPSGEDFDPAYEKIHFFTDNFIYHKWCPFAD